MKMKRFESGGKWLIGLFALVLAFGGCAGPSSEEGSVPNTSDQYDNAIPMTLENGQLYIGEGGDGAVARLNGHTVEIRNGDTGCYNTGDVSACWIRVINRDSDEYMANVFTRISKCGTSLNPCTGTEIFDNADRVDGNTTHKITGADGNVGASSAPYFAGTEHAVVEDGNYNLLTPYNEMGAPWRQCYGDGAKKPHQILHPRCGSRSILWDFGGRTSQYRFWTTILADYYPWNATGDNDIYTTGDNDPRYNFQDRGTYYVMICDLADNLASYARRTWYRLGSYKRSNIVAGWNAISPGYASFAPNRYFALNVAAELPDRMESYNVADASSFTNYEYPILVSILLHFDPKTVDWFQRASGKTPGGTTLVSGARDICSSDVNCGLGKETYRGFDAPAAAFNPGFIITYENMVSTIQFNYLPYGSQYQTVRGGNANIMGSYLPGHMGQHGRAHLRVPVGGTTTLYNPATGVIQEGPDNAPEIPVAMYYFFTKPGASGRGSPFWLDLYSGSTSFMYAWTNRTLLPGGFASGSDDWPTYCWPMQPGYINNTQQGCDPGVPMANYLVYLSQEVNNLNISHTGKAAYGGGGAIQQVPAYVCVQ